MARLVKGLVEEIFEAHDGVAVLAHAKMLLHDEEAFNRAVGNASREHLAVGDAVEFEG